jgi:multidrug resistance protein, MATE family
MVRMLLVIGRTDWATEAKLAQQLAGAGAIDAGENSGRSSQITKFAAASSGGEKLDMLIDLVIEHPSDHC